MELYSELVLEDPGAAEADEHVSVGILAEGNGGRELPAEGHRARTARQPDFGDHLVVGGIQARQGTADIGHEIGRAHV